MFIFESRHFPSPDLVFPLSRLGVAKMCIPWIIPHNQVILKKRVRHKYTCAKLQISFIYFKFLTFSQRYFTLSSIGGVYFAVCLTWGGQYQCLASLGTRTFAHCLRRKLPLSSPINLPPIFSYYITHSIPSTASKPQRNSLIFAKLLIALTPYLAASFVVIHLASSSPFAVFSILQS